MENFAVSTPYAYQPNTEKTLEDLIKQLAAVAQTAQSTLLARQKTVEARLTKAENFIETRLQDIQSTITHFQTILKGSGAQDWRTVAETLQKEGAEHVNILEKAAVEVHIAVRESCNRLDQASIQIVKSVNKTLATIRPAELEQLAEDANESIQRTAELAQQQMVRTDRWFNWKNLLMVFFLTLTVTLSIDLYMDDEWPWEVHNNNVKERATGQAVMSAWQQLSAADQQLILNSFA